MSREVSGLDLIEDGGDFRLSVTDETGNTTSVRLTPHQVLTLAQSAPSFRERILAPHNPSGGAVQAVVATPVVQIGLNQDSLGEEILLTLIAPNGARATYAIPLHIAEHLVERLPVRVAELKKSRTRQ